MKADMLLTLHAVRLLGFATTGAVADRFQQDPSDVESQLIDAGTQGFVAHHSFAGTAGWSLSEKGRAVNEQLLREELHRTGGRSTVADVQVMFTALNAVVVSACSALQMTPHAPAGAALVLRRALDDWIPLEAQLAVVLPRMDGYARRLAHALDRQSDPAWITGTDRDSYHHAWFELHEDLIATLGLRRDT